MGSTAQRSYRVWGREVRRADTKPSSLSSSAHLVETIAVTGMLSCTLILEFSVLSRRIRVRNARGGTPVSILSSISRKSQSRMK